MPRPSLKDQRSDQILDAYLTCVARFGLDGATQERIAKQAGVKRPLLRHYLGNKDEMVTALANHVVHGFDLSTEMLAVALTGNQTSDTLIEFLFTDDEESDPRLMVAWQALTVAVGDHPAMGAPLIGSLAKFLNTIESALRRVAPNAPPTRIRAVAQGIAASYANLVAIEPLKPPKEWREDLKESARLLAASLETEQ